MAAICVLLRRLSFPFHFEAFIVLCLSHIRQHTRERMSPNGQVLWASSTREGIDFNAHFISSFPFKLPPLLYKTGRNNKKYRNTLNWPQIIGCYPAAAAALQNCETGAGPCNFLVMISVFIIKSEFKKYIFHWKQRVGHIPYSIDNPVNGRPICDHGVWLPVKTTKSDGKKKQFYTICCNAFVLCVANFEQIISKIRM